MGKLVVMQETVNFVGSEHPDRIEGFGNEWIPTGEGQNKYFVQSEEKKQFKQNKNE